MRRSLFFFIFPLWGRTMGIKSATSPFTVPRPADDANVVETKIKKCSTTNPTARNLAFSTRSPLHTYRTGISMFMVHRQPGVWQLVPGRVSFGTARSPSLAVTPVKYRGLPCGGGVARSRGRERLGKAGALQGKLKPKKILKIQNDMTAYSGIE